MLFRSPVNSAAYTRTYNRMDALFFGVTLAYFRCFHYDHFTAFVTRHCRVILLGSFLLLLPALHYASESRWMLTQGLSLVYLGFGGIFSVCIVRKDIFQKCTANIFFKALCSIGTYSYTIYLWHAPAYIWSYIYLIRSMPQSPLLIFYWTMLYITGSIFFGIFTAKIIERPFLKIRDRLFLSRADPIEKFSAVIN